MSESRSEFALRSLTELCSLTPDRRPGGPANRAATRLVAGAFRDAGWVVECQPFPCMDWEATGAFVIAAGESLTLEPSPYGLGVEGVGPIRVVRTVDDLGRRDLAGSILVLDGPISSEPLTPRDFPFYRSEDHTRILDRLEAAKPLAVVAVTGRYPELCGAMDPFPLIEDGTFDIAAAAVRRDVGSRLVTADGTTGRISIAAQRRQSEAENVVARRGSAVGRLLVIAHIDSKPGTPGAVDNAAGVVVLMLLARSMSPPCRPHLSVGVELLAVNGEDHFQAPGEQAWLERNAIDQVAAAINIDGAGYQIGATAVSTYNLAPPAEQLVERVVQNHRGVVRGPVWYQSDHAIFAMRGRPALAFTSERLDLLLSEVYHAPTDTPDQVAIDRLIELADFLDELISRWETRDQASRSIVAP